MDQRTQSQIRVFLATTKVGRLIIFPAAEIGVDCWFRPYNGEESKFNFVVTDGRLLAATRWGHSLSCVEQRGRSITGGSDRPLHSADTFRAVYVASEATEGDGWREVPDRSLLVVDERLEMHAASLT